jgi:hypothetical protein
MSDIFLSIFCLIILFLPLYFFYRIFKAIKEDWKARLAATQNLAKYYEAAAQNLTKQTEKIN